MSARRVAVLAAVGCVAVWALKALAIAVAGGLDKSPVEGPLFALGLLLFAVAWVAFGVAVTAGRGTAMQVVGAIVGLLVAALLFMFVEDPVGALVPESAGWVTEEAGLWAISLITAAVVLVWSRGRQERY
jgi:membrane associated rhomboid family serine protease